MDCDINPVIADVVWQELHQRGWPAPNIEQVNLPSPGKSGDNSGELVQSVMSRDVFLVLLDPELSLVVRRSPSGPVPDEAVHVGRHFIHGGSPSPRRRPAGRDR